MKIQVSSSCRTARGSPCGHSPRHTRHHTKDRVLSRSLGECDKHLDQLRGLVATAFDLPHVVLISSLESKPFVSTATLSPAVSMSMRSLHVMDGILELNNRHNGNTATCDKDTTDDVVRRIFGRTCSIFCSDYNHYHLEAETLPAFIETSMFWSFLRTLNSCITSEEKPRKQDTAAFWS